MRPATGWHKAALGLFVAAALAILAGGVLTIGDLRETFSSKITVQATFPEVAGLAVGDNVWCSGMKVGVVKKLHITDDALVEVQMQLDSDVTRYVHVDSVARLGADGLIGNPIVIIDGGSTDADPIADGSTLAVEGTVTTTDVLAMLQENNKKLLAITTDLEVVVARLEAGEGTIGKLLVDDSLYTNVSTTVKNLETASANAKSMTDSLVDFSANLNEEGQLPHQIVTDRELHATITNSADQLQKATEAASRLAETLADSAEDPGTPMGTAVSDEALAKDLAETMKNLNNASALLAEDLEALQSNFLLRRHFKKKEREERRAKKAAEQAE